jgi:tripartite-type tricarboxylate transporter receptor subunit TctC
MEPNVVKVLHDAFAKGMREPAYAEAMARLDQELAYLNSADYEKFALEQIEEARRYIAELGLKQN